MRISLVSCATGRLCMAVLIYEWASASGTSMMTGFRTPHLSINSSDKDIDDMLTLCTDVPSLVDMTLCQMKD